MSADSETVKAQVFIGDSPGSVYTILGEDFLSSVFDIEGEQFIDGGVDSHSLKFLKKFKNPNGLFVSAPTPTDLKSSSALDNVPVIANLKGGSTSQLKNLATGAGFHGIRSAPLFNPKYEPYVIYKSLVKGELVLYVIAGDEKDAEKLSKSAGNEDELKKVATEHGTVAVLVWKPANNKKPVLRALLSGTCSFDRIQKALDRASRALSFLNAPVIRTGDKPIIPPTTSVPSRSAPKPTSKTTSAPSARAQPNPSRQGGKPNVASVRPLSAQSTRTSKPQPSRPVAPTARVAPTKPTVARPTTSKPSTAPVRSRPAAVRPETTRTRQPPGPSSVSRPPIKTAKVAPQVITKQTAGNSVARNAASQSQSRGASSSVAHIIPKVVVTEENSVKYRGNVAPDVFVKPPTPEPEENNDQHEDTPVSQETNQEAAQQIENVSTSSSNSSGERNVLEAPVEQDPIEEQKVAAVEPNSARVTENDFSFDGDLYNEAIIIENSGMNNLSTSTNETTFLSEVSNAQDTTDNSVLVDLKNPIISPIQPSSVLDALPQVSDMSDLANQLGNIALDSPLPFVSAISEMIVGNYTIPSGAIQTNDNDNIEQQGEVVENSKHDLMQERSTVISNDNKDASEYGQADPVLGGALDACTTESDKIDEQSFNQQEQQLITITESETLEMIKDEAVIYKGPKVGRLYYFDFVTLPRNEQLETTLGKLEMREFVHKIRSRHYILASKNIEGAVLESINYGFKLWEDSNLKCTIHPTHHNQAVAQFRESHDKESQNFEVRFPIANSILRNETGEEYTVVRTPLRDEFD